MLFLKMLHSDNEILLKTRDMSKTDEVRWFSVVLVFLLFWLVGFLSNFPQPK